MVGFLIPVSKNPHYTALSDEIERSSLEAFHLNFFRSRMDDLGEDMFCSSAHRNPPDSKAKHFLKDVILSFPFVPEGVEGTVAKLLS